MKRWLIIFGTMIGLLAGVLMGVVPAFQQIRKGETDRAYLEELKGRMESVGTQIHDRQLSLAKWYNWNLQTETPADGFREAYGEILNTADGVMGLLILEQVELPICHQGRTVPIPAAEHDAQSALPIGGRGNHCVLYLPETVDLSEITQDTTAVIICCGQRLFYRPAGEENGEKDIEDLLTLASADKTRNVLFRRCEGITLIPSQDVQAQKRLFCRALAASVLTGLLPVFAGSCLRGVDMLRRLQRFYRINRGKSEISR